MKKHVLTLGLLLAVSSSAWAGNKPMNEMYDSTLEVYSRGAVNATPTVVAKVDRKDLQYDYDSDDERDVVKKKTAARSTSGCGTGIMSYLSSIWKAIVSLFA